MMTVLILLVAIVLVYYFRGAIKSVLLGTESFLNQGKTVTLYYADWCPHCIIMKPIWQKLKSEMNNSKLRFIENDEEKNKTPGINGYPTIRLINEAGRAFTYGGGQDYNQLKSWLVNMR